MAFVQADLVKMAHQQRMSLEVEIANYRKEEIQQQGVVASLHKQKTQLAADADHAAAELAAAQADCQAKDGVIAGLHAQVCCAMHTLASSNAAGAALAVQDDAR